MENTYVSISLIKDEFINEEFALISEDVNNNLLIFDINSACFVFKNVGLKEHSFKLKVGIPYIFIGNNKVVGCLVTHFHQDHIEALEEVVSYYEVEINKESFGKFKYETIETPGHTFDSKTFYFSKDKIMFTGDFIFKDGIGRTDLGGNDKDMINSINDFMKYNDDIILYPGHGPSTTLGQEKNNLLNYYK